MPNIDKNQILQIKKAFEESIGKITDEKALEELKIKFLGRKGQLSQLLRQLKDLTIEQRKEAGSFLNQTKLEIVEGFKQLEKKFKPQDAADDFFDVTVPGKKQRVGAINVIAQTQREIERIFSSLGFEIADGPEIETEWYNFDALNVPAGHPARDMQDTFWLKNKNSKGEKLLPRTQTSNVQIRYMENHKPPLKIVVPGRVYRNENTDANHEHTFYQFEVLVVDKKISVANFKDIAAKFFTEFFGQETKIRLRPSYFPFTEPSFEFDVSCTVCGGKGCKTCKGGGWLELGGAGMVNQRVFEAVGFKRGQWQGFAWGFGIERLAMMKHQIDDIRFFKNGDLRFIRQF